MKEINEYFEAYVTVPRIKMAKKKTIKTMINEEVLLLAKCIRNEIEKWKPRSVVI